MEQRDEKKYEQTSHAEITDAQANSVIDDDEQLAHLGHVQELERAFSIRSLGGLCLCLMVGQHRHNTDRASC